MGDGAVADSQRIWLPLSLSAVLIRGTKVDNSILILDYPNTYLSLSLGDPLCRALVTHVMKMPVLS